MKNFFVYVLCSFLLFSCTGKSKKQILRVPLGGDIISMDPMEITDRYSSKIVRHIYEGLYEYHYLKEPYELTPLLAEALPKIKDNGLTYIIKIKKNVFFHDDDCFKETNGVGREVTAEDFIYSIKRLLLSPQTQNIFFTTVIKESVKGAKDFKDFATDIAGLKAIDKYTLQIKLNKTTPYFPSILARPNGSIVAKEAVEYYKNDFKFNPVGTGPFTLRSWRKGDRILLDKNEKYSHSTYPTEKNLSVDEELLKDAGKKIPFLDRIIFYIMVDDKPRWESFLNNKIDTVPLDKDSYYDAFPIGEMLSEELQKKETKVFRNSLLETNYYTFNMKDPLVGKNKYLRQAISTAYDGYKHNALFDNNISLFANWLLPPGMFGSDPTYKNPYREFNVDKAKELLKKAGYPKGEGLPEIELLIAETSSTKQIANFFMKSMEDVGIKIRIKTLPFRDLLKEVGAGNFQIASLRWRADLPFPEDFLRILHGGAVSPGPNRALFKNNNYDQLYEKVFNIKFYNLQKLDLIKKMREIAVEESPLIPLSHSVTIILTKGYVGNFKPQSFGGYTYKYTKINNEKKLVINKK